MLAQFGIRIPRKLDIFNIEKIQRRASIFVTNSYLWSISVSNLINNLGWKVEDHI